MAREAPRRARSLRRRLGACAAIAASTACFGLKPDRPLDVPSVGDASMDHFDATRPDTSTEMPLDGSVAEVSDDAGPDSGLDAAFQRCDARAPFTSITPLQGIPGPASPGSLSADELTIWYSVFSTRWYSPALGSATRFDVSQPFTSPQTFDPLTTSDAELTMTADLNTVFVIDGNTGSLLASTRSDPSLPFPAAVPVLDGGGNAGPNFGLGSLGADGTTLAYVMSPKGYDPFRIYLAQVSGTALSNLRPVPELDPDDAGLDEAEPVLSSDGLTLYWVVADSSVVPSVSLLYSATRPDRNAPFAGAAPVPELNQPAQDPLRELPSYGPFWISPDNCRLYLQRNSGISMASR